MNFQEAFETFAPMWNSPKRFYHTVSNHLIPMLTQCQTAEEKYFALFHDIIYDPYAGDNEEQSVELFRQHEQSFDDLEDGNLVVDMIMATKTHTFGDNEQINRMLDLDIAILRGPLPLLIEYESLVFKEYQKYDLDKYIEGRCNFLSGFLQKHLEMQDAAHYKALPSLISYIRNKKYKIGIYAGSFDPFHVGHLDILHKAEKLFDKVIVVRGTNPSKPPHEYSMPISLPNQIIEHTGLISELFTNNCTMVRGLRNEVDVAPEMNYMEWVHEFNKDIPFVHLFCDPAYSKISSSVLRGLSKFDGVDIDKWRVS